MRIFAKKSVWLLLSVYLAFWLVIAIVGSMIAADYKEYIDDFMGLESYEYVGGEGDEGIDAQYYRSAFMNEGGGFDSERLWEYSVDLAEKVQAGGSVVLWDNGTLPLGEGKKVSCFGRACGSNGQITGGFRYSGAGSGSAFSDGDMYDDTPTVYSALTEAGLDVNKTLYDAYCEMINGDYSSFSAATTNEIPWSEVNEYSDTFAQYGDAALIFIGRHGGENGELTPTGSDCIDKDALQLHENERQIIEQAVALKKSGVFGKVIVLLNTPTAGINMDLLTTYRGDVDSCVWIGQSGYVGLNAVGDLLSGKDGVRAEGHLPDTVAYLVSSNPAEENPQTSYTNSSEFGYTPNEVTSDGDYRSSYLVYAENIYVGYKYFETRYEDAVLGDEGARSAAGVKGNYDSWVYSREVAFPFGWSAYNDDFEYGDFSCEKNADGDYVVKVTVTNVGETAARDAVQIYIQKPYTEHDKQFGIEQASVNLCGYAVTETIPAGETDDVTVVVSAHSLKTYDSNHYKTYIREAGDYFLTAAEDAHGAVNNILAAKGKTPGNTNGVMDAEGDPSMVTKFSFDDTDTESFAVSATGKEIVNRFDHADWNKYKSDYQAGVTYLSRRNWSGTYPTEAELTFTDKMAEDMEPDSLFGNGVTGSLPDKDTFPTYNMQYGINLVALMGKNYDDGEWDKLLDQLTVEECAVLLHGFNGSATLNSIAKPKERVYDGPLGSRTTYKGKVDGKSHNGMAFPIAPLVAATFDNELARLVGDAKGEGLLHGGASGLYGTAMNIHRSHYCGRNFEYYSEDPYLCGRIGMNETAGLQGKNLNGEEKGTFVTLKHFVLNETERHRYGIATYLNEQTMREVYLAAFEPSVTEAHARSVMSSFARIGPVWAGGDYSLMTEVLRGEWGFDGYAVSDGNRRDYMGVKDALYAGNDFILNAAAALDTEYADLIKSDISFAWLARESVHRILYVTANCSAVNGLTASMSIEQLRSWWEDALLGAQIMIGCLFAACIVMTVLCFVLGREKVQQAYAVRRREKLAAQVVKYGSVDRARSVARRKNIAIVASSLIAAAVVIAYIATSVTLHFTATPRVFDMVELMLEVNNSSAFYAGDELPLEDIALSGKYADGRLKSIDTDEAQFSYVLSDGQKVPADGTLYYGITGINAEYGGFSVTSPLTIKPGKVTFEAEDAIIYAPASKARTAAINTASGGRYVYNLANETEGASVSFYIRADRAASADLLVTLADPTMGAYSFNKLFTVTLNGEPVNGTDISYAKQGASLATKWSENKYAELQLQEGVNEIVFTKGAFCTNFDCIALSSEAALTSAVNTLEAEDMRVDSTSYRVSAIETASGGYCVDSVRKLAGEFTFEFDASAAETASLYIDFARSSKVSDLATMIEKVVVNETEYVMGREISDVEIANGAYGGFSALYLCDVELLEGENTLKIYAPGDGAIDFYNFDRIMLVGDVSVTHKKTVTLEAENAVIDGKENIKTGTSSNNFPSGGSWAENPKLDDNYGSFTFTFVADEAGMADLYLRMGSYGTSNTSRMRNLSQVFDKLTVNGTEYVVGTDLADKTFYGAGASKYWEWSLASLGTIDVTEGVNTVVVHKAPTGDWLNFDCMLLCGYVGLQPYAGGEA